jgi:hypothetical protein
MRKRTVVVIAILAAAALAVAGSALSRSSAPPTLKGVVGPGYTIKMTKGSKKVTSLKAGKYKFVINDKAAIHNYTVEREKPSKPKLEYHVTSTPFVGSKTKVITLKPGSWRAYCSVHESLMHIDFKVTK